MKSLEYFDENTGIDKNNPNFIHRCSICKIPKKNIEYYPKKKQGNSRRYESCCISCNVNRTKKYKSNRNPFRICTKCKLLKEHSKGGDICKDCTKEYTLKVKDITTNRRLKKDYGITLEDYNALLKIQNNNCGLCEDPLIPNIGMSRNSNVDHDHLTGKVRNILCHNCNVGLGHFKDNIDLLYKAIAYLKFHNKVNIINNE